MKDSKGKCINHEWCQKELFGKCTYEQDENCDNCSCLECNINGNPDKSCLPKDVVQLMNGCMTCYLCMINNEYIIKNCERQL